MSNPTCPKCGGDFQPGIIIDLTFKVRITGDETPFQTQWVGIGADEIEKGKWIGAVKNLRGRPRRDVVTHCCEKCGYLESYATPAS